MPMSLDGREPRFEKLAESRRAKIGGSAKVSFAGCTPKGSAQRIAAVRPSRLKINHCSASGRSHRPTGRALDAAAHALSCSVRWGDADRRSRFAYAPAASLEYHQRRYQ